MRGGEFLDIIIKACLWWIGLVALVVWLFLMTILVYGG